MQVNKKVVIAVFGITGISILRAWSTQLAINTNPATKAGGVVTAPLTPIIMGGYIVLLVAAVIDLFGGPASAIVGNIALLALFTVVLTQFPWALIFTALNPPPQQKAG